MVSVIVPVYNGAHVLLQSVPAVLALRGVEEWIWVDDGSDDGTALLLERLLAERPGARRIAHERNLGRASARNTGARSAGGDILVFLDADVDPAPGAAEGLAQALGAPDAVAAVGRLASVPSDPADPYADYLALYPRGPAGRPGEPAPWKHFVTALCAVRAQAFHAVGGFDPSVGYGEDLLLACRLARHWPDGLRAADAAGEIRDVGTLDTARAKLAAFARDLVASAGTCPDAFRVAGLERLNRPTPATRLLRLRWLAGAVERSLSWLPPRGRAAAVRYLLGHTLVHALADARSHAAQHA